MPVAHDVAVLAADDEQHELLAVARVPELARRRGVGVGAPALAELARLAAALDASTSAIQKVDLVLLVVLVEQALEARRAHHAVDAERRHAERCAHLATAGALPELVQRTKRVTAHRRRTIPSA